MWFRLSIFSRKMEWSSLRPTCGFVRWQSILASRMKGKARPSKRQSAPSIDWRKWSEGQLHNCSVRGVHRVWKGHKMKIDGVGPSVALGQQPIAPASAATQPSQKIKPGHWASPAGTSALTHKVASRAERARTLIGDAIAESKRDGGPLHEKLANAFLEAPSTVRQAMRGDRLYKKIIREWASQVGDALNGARTTIHPGDQGMRELHRVAKGLPPELAADLVVSAVPRFVDCSKYIVRHDKDKPAIFSSKDKVPVSKPSPDVEASKPSPDVEASKPNPDIEASTPNPEASKPSPDVEASKPNPDADASKPSPAPKAPVPEFAKYTYLDDLTAWIRRAEIP